MNNIVEYIGIAEKLPENIRAYKQFILKDSITLEDRKYGAKDIIKIVANPIITNRRVIKTAEGIALDGEKLTGVKYLIKGFIDLKIYYQENSSIGLLGYKNQSVKFYIAIELEKEFMSSSDLLSTIYIEDIYSEVIDEREVFTSIVATIIIEGDNDYE